MHQPTFPTFRSTSLPNPTKQNRASPFNLQHKRDSGFLAGEGPITPPMSPGHSEEDDGSISVDTEPRYSGHRHEIPIDIDTRLYPEAGPRRESRSRPEQCKPLHMTRQGLRKDPFDRHLDHRV